MVAAVKVTSSQYYAEASNEWRGSSPRLSAEVAQKGVSGGEPLATLCPAQKSIPRPTAPIAMSLTSGLTGGCLQIRFSLFVFMFQKENAFYEVVKHFLQSNCIQDVCPWHMRPESALYYDEHEMQMTCTRKPMSSYITVNNSAQVELLAFQCIVMSSQFSYI